MKKKMKRKMKREMTNSSWLPTLVLNKIFGYLCVKERVKCKLICRAWREEIELGEQKNDTLILHLGPYPWNMRWSETNNRGLMKFENSLELKNLKFLQYLLTKPPLKKIKKLAILNFFRNPFEPEASNIRSYLGYLKQCEEIELLNFQFNGTLTFALPKLKTLVFQDSPVEKLLLKCPSLEVLVCSSTVEEIHFQSTKKLKRLICFGWPARVSLNGKLGSLEYLNLFAAGGKLVNGHLLDLMPKLKRFVLYSSNLQADLVNIREQQRRFGLSNLEILPSGFRESVEIALDGQGPFGFVRIDRCAGELFDNYSKLVENSPWRVFIDYSALFGKFKILPSNFFERFGASFEIEISKVTSYAHLFAFLKCYPFVRQLSIHFSKVKANHILDLVHFLQPSLQRLTIFEERPSDVLEIDLSFMGLFNLVQVKLKSTHLPVEFIRKVMARTGPQFNGLLFSELITGHRMGIHCSPYGFLLVDSTIGSTPMFSTVDQLNAFLQSEPHLRTFLLV